MCPCVNGAALLFLQGCWFEGCSTTSSRYYRSCMFFDLQDLFCILVVCSLVTGNVGTVVLKPSFSSVPCTTFPLLDPGTLLLRSVVDITNIKNFVFCHEVVLSLRNSYGDVMVCVCGGGGGGGLRIRSRGH
jgi:hypothetical protein